MSYQSTVIADGPYGYWRLNEASGTVATDLGSGGNSGVYVGTGTQGGSSLLVGDSTAKSYSPTGNSSNYVRIPAPLSSYPTASAFTLESWVKPASGDSGAGNVQSYLLSNRDPLTSSNGADWGLQTKGDATNSHAEGNIAARSFNDASSAGSLVVGSAYHLVYTYDKATGNRGLYVNGTAVITITGGGTFPPAWPSGTSTTPPIIFGQIGGSTTSGIATGFVLFGAMSDVAVYSKVLTAAQVLSHYTAGTTASGTTGNATQSATATIIAKAVVTYPATAVIQVVAAQAYSATAAIKINATQTSSATAVIRVTSTQAATATATIKATAAQTFPATAYILAPGKGTVTASATATIKNTGAFFRSATAFIVKPTFATSATAYVIAVYVVAVGNNAYGSGAIGNGSSPTDKGNAGVTE